MNFLTMFWFSEKYSYRIILAILVGMFFLLYAWFSYQTTTNHPQFASPDETANYFWTERFANDEQLSYVESLNLIANDTVIPRSVRSDDGVVRPVSFLGIILIYGTIGKVFGMWVVPFLTPLFAVIGVLCFYGIIKRVFDDKTALWSALLFFALAPYWYYTSRSMFHNVLFIDLVLAGVWLSLRARLPARQGATLAGGICIGLAIITRTSELIWLVPMIFLTGVWGYRFIGWKKLTLFVVGLCVALVPMLYYNNALYGDYLQFGYEQGSRAVDMTDKDDDAVETQPSSAAGRYIASLQSVILPFGFHPRVMWQNFVNHYVVLLWYLFWPALLGGIWFVWRWQRHPSHQQLYVIAFVVVSSILGIYYGSWAVQDSIARNTVTIGGSHARYWLAIYIMSIPLAVMFFQNLLFSDLSFPRRRESRIATHWIPAFAGMTLVLFFACNTYTVIFSQGEGLYDTQRSIAHDARRAAQVISLVEPNAVIATNHLDKAFWSARNVIATDLSDEVKNRGIAALLAAEVPVYYYGFIFTDEDLALLNDERLQEFNINIEPVLINEVEKLGLYKFVL